MLTMVLSKNPIAVAKWHEYFRPRTTLGLALSAFLLVTASAQPSGLGDVVINFLDSHDVDRGSTWDVWEENYATPDWIVSHPGRNFLGQSERFLPVAETCDTQILDDGRNCDLDYHLVKCVTDDDCLPKELCPVGDSGPVWDCPSHVNKTNYFARSSCEILDSTQKGVGMPKEKLCVGHSYSVYERMYNHIIQAERFVDITSLDSFDAIGGGGTGMEFAAAMRNAITYLASTGKQITVRLHFGIPITDVDIIAEEMTRDWDRHEAVNNVDLHVSTYIVANANFRDFFTGSGMASASWNHGKILAVDGDKLFTGGTNYYTKDYLLEDPVSDVNLQIHGQATETAHAYANMLHRGGCQIEVGILPADWSGAYNAEMIGYAWRTRDGVRPDYDSESDMGPSCPPQYVSSLHRRETGASGTPFRIIPAARLDLLPQRLNDTHTGIKYGSKTSDLAMYAMITNAERSVKISQQDMLPMYFYGTLATRGAANEGYPVGSFIDQTTGITKFDDTWRKVEAVATALSKGVTVSIMVSAPCAIAAHPEGFYGAESAYGGPTSCNEDGTVGNGYDYWARVYDHNQNSWPPKRDIDNRDLFLPPTERENGNLSSNSLKDAGVTLEQRKLLEGSGYGYGWSLDNIADWYYAYLAIFPEKRPTDTDGRPVSDGEVVDLICKYAEIGHMRMTAEESTYVRVDEDGVSHRGGQVGNHAKVVMADDSIFYVGSDNMYAGGLAEFGIVVDDQAQGQHFEQEYYGPHWRELLGTVESPGLVSGVGSRLAAGCPWKEKLPARPKPWMDIGLIIAYGDRIYFESDEGDNWLGYSSGAVTATDASSLLGTFVNVLEEFRWTIRSSLNDAVDLPSDPREDVVKQTPDPSAGSCVKFGDIVYLQNNVQNNLWLSSSNGDVEANDHTPHGDKTTYQWDVHSAMTAGVDPRAGSCILDGDGVYLKSNSVDNQWLTKAMDGNGVSTSDASVGNSLWRAEFSATNIGDPCTSDDECDSGHCTSEYICAPKIPLGERCNENAECISGRCESFGHFINQVYKTCVGKAGYGSSCNEDSDCMNDSCTWGFICGDPCIPGHSDCASNQYCSALSMGTCLDKQADGTGCIPGFHQCENTCLLGTCGRPCNGDGDCESGTEQCGDGLGLSSSSWICHPRSGLGGPCWQDHDCVDEDTGCTWLGTCGQGCTLDLQCGEDERCSWNMICEQKLPNGAWCGEDDDCMSGFCRMAGCVEEAEPVSEDSYCGNEISLLEPFLNPPDPVQNFLSMAIGVDADWDIDTIDAFAASSGEATCGRLATIMNSPNSTEERFIMLAISERNGTNSSSLLMGDAANDERCARERERTGSDTCPATETQVAEKERENPGSFGLGRTLPICMGLRFCNADDVIDGSVKFGFTTDARNGQGIRFGKIGPCNVEFKSLSFDTAGRLPFTFHAPLINPTGGPRITQPRGGHFLIEGRMSLPLTKTVAESDETRNMGTVAIHTAQIGMYSELEINGTNTSDVVKVIGHLGNLGELARNLDRLQFQLFFDAQAEISINLGELFPLPGNFTLTFFEGSLSSLLDVQIQIPEHRNERRHWYLGSVGQTCNQVCDIYHLQCTDKSIDEQSSLRGFGLAHEAFFEAGLDCSTIEDVGDTVAGAPFHTPDGCFTPRGQSNYRSTCNATESHTRSLCYCEDTNNYYTKASETGEIAVTESTQTKTVADCVHEGQTWMQDTYIALSISAQVSTRDLAAILSPFRGFGEFLAGLLPGGNATDARNPVDDVTGLMLAARVYLKLPLSGYAHFIIQFEASIVINCDFIITIREWAGEWWEHLPGAPAIDAFCALDDPTLRVTISLGFEGFAIDETNSYLEFQAGDHTMRIEFNIFPECPAPVLTGGSCVRNSDCASSDVDPESNTCSAYHGYCLSHSTWHTARACLGTCVQKYPDGASCSGDALNLHPLDIDYFTGDDDVCQSGRCDSQTLTCQPKLPNDERCWEDEDCVSGRCASTLPFTCQPLVGEGEGCAMDDDCESGGCSWALTCGLPCLLDSHCSTGRCSRNLICEPLLPNDERCMEDEDCRSGRCARDFTCQNLLGEGWRCLYDDDCQSNNCALHWTGYYCTSGSSHFIWPEEETQMIASA